MLGLGAVALALLIFAAMAALETIRVDAWLIAVGIASVGVITWQASKHSATLAGLTFVGGFIGVLVGAIQLLPGTSLPTAFCLIVLAASILLGLRAGLAVAVLISLALALMPSNGSGLSGDSAQLGVLLVWLAAGLSWLALRTIYCALDWAWSSYLSSVEKLEELRDKQAELASLSKSLTETCVRLEALSADLERAREAAEEARRLKTEFATSISHELRTPLNLIIGFSEMMVISPDKYDGETLPATYRGDLEAIYRNACHLSNLIDDVLDLARIDAHRMALHKAQASLQEIVDEAVATVATMFKDKGLELRVELPDDPIPLVVDRTRIRQVLINLLANAARVTSRGGATIRALSGEREVVLAVADTGIGLAPEDVPRVFEEFRQFETFPRQRGSGLGLAVSKRFVELHGGNMWLESRRGEGTTFYFSLPTSENVVALVPETPWERLAPKGDEGKSSEMLVMLDDDPEATKIFKRYLNDYPVLSVARWDDVPRVVQTGHVIACLAATEGARAACRRWQQGQTGALGSVPIITCSLRTRRVAAEELGADAYLLKPLTAEQLRSTLASLRRRTREVLVVDDDPDMVRLLSRMLRKASRHRRVIEAHGGAEALELLAHAVPDLVLLDLLMPDVDGYTVLTRMRADPRLHHVPVVVITAREYGDESVVADRLEISRLDGLTVGEVMSCVAANLSALRTPKARSSEPTPRAAPAG